MKIEQAAAIALVALVLQGCGASDGDASATAADTLTRAQRDSIVATLPIPGAGGVGAALRARDGANARTQVHDSLGG
jgi:hypothetical protein